MVYGYRSTVKKNRGRLKKLWTDNREQIPYELSGISHELTSRLTPHS